MKTPKAKQLPSGSWFCRIRINGEDISITRPTEKEAIAEAMAVKAGIKQATARKQKKVTAAIDSYIAARENVLSPSTVRGYRAIQTGRFQGMMHKDIHTLSAAQWQKAVNDEAKLCSAKTLTNAWRFLASVIFAETGQRVIVRLPQVVPNARPYLTPEQIPVFVAAIHGTSIEIPALLALSSLRRSELQNLRWRDIDFDANILRVNGAAVYGPDGELVRKNETKNKTSRRTVPLIEPLRAALQQADQTGEYIVTMTPNAIMGHVNRVCAKHGLPQVGLHGLRHSFASLAYHLGIPELVVMEIGGWANDQTMRKIYTHISQKDVADRAAALMTFFSTKNGNENDNDIG